MEGSDDMKLTYLFAGLLASLSDLGDGFSEKAC